MVTISLTISAVLAIVFGLAVLLFPKLMRWAVGLWLIVWGILQFF
jgi:uncharacterized membrane protein